MAVNPSSAMFWLSIPPIRGFVSLLMLFMVTGMLFQEGDLGIGGRIALTVFILLLGTAVWVFTLHGFVRDVREPRRLDEAVIVAHRPRRTARVISWIALALVILDGLAFGALLGTGAPDWAGVLCVLSFLVALLVASTLPGLSRRYADGAGVVAVSPRGVHLVPDRAEAQEVLPWGQTGMRDPIAGLGRRVQWRPGAHAAVRRWADEGFTPTIAEVRQLHLDPRWSPDPAALRPSRASRWTIIAVQGWATLVSGLLGGAMIWAVATGQAPWWILLVLGWAPLLGFAVLAPRFLRILRTDETRAAEVTEAGWVDHLHGQDLVRWEHVERIELHGRHTLVISRAEAPRFRDRDLGNRMNNWLTAKMRQSPVRIRSAGPLFREIGPRHLPYAPETGAFRLAATAERRGQVTVRRREPA